MFVKFSYFVKAIRQLLAFFFRASHPSGGKYKLILEFREIIKLHSRNEMHDNYRSIKCKFGEMFQELIQAVWFETIIVIFALKNITKGFNKGFMVVLQQFVPQCSPYRIRHVHVHEKRQINDTSCIPSFLEEFQIDFSIVFIFSTSMLNKQKIYLKVYHSQRFWIVKSTVFVILKQHVVSVVITMQ